jgi:hypothetical protein
MERSLVDAGDSVEVLEQPLPNLDRIFALDPNSKQDRQQLGVAQCAGSQVLQPLSRPFVFVKIGNPETWGSVGAHGSSGLGCGSGWFLVCVNYIRYRRRWQAWCGYFLGFHLSFSCERWYGISFLRLPRSVHVDFELKTSLTRSLPACTTVRVSAASSPLRYLSTFRW